MEQISGLLETLRSQVGCEYLSDLQQRKDCNRRARVCLEKIRTSDYAVWQWKDAVQYLYDMEVDFCTFEDVDEWRG